MVRALSVTVALFLAAVFLSVSVFADTITVDSDAVQSAVDDVLDSYGFSDYLDSDAVDSAVEDVLEVSSVDSVTVNSSASAGSYSGSASDFVDAGRVLEIYEALLPRFSWSDDYILFSLADGEYLCVSGNLDISSSSVSGDSLIAYELVFDSSSDGYSFYVYDDFTLDLELDNGILVFSNLGNYPVLAADYYLQTTLIFVLLCLAFACFMVVTFSKFLFRGGNVRVIKD